MADCRANLWQCWIRRCRAPMVTAFSVEFLVAHTFGFVNSAFVLVRALLQVAVVFNDSRQAKAPRGGTESMRTLLWTAACV